MVTLVLHRPNPSPFSLFPPRVAASLSRHASHASDQAVEAALAAAITQIVSSASRQQSLKGIVTAGLWRSLIYGAEKLKKRFGSK